MSMGFSRGFFGFVLGMTLLTGTFAAQKRPGIPWDEDNKPTWFANDYEYHFKLLPQEGKSAFEPWTDTYWPNREGGVAARWMMGRRFGFGYQLYSKEELKALSPEEISQLSPAEKYDIMNGNYDYPTVRAEWMRVSPNDPEWTGICHGWASASSSFREPKAVTRKNKDDIEVRFGSSDVKAMLSYLYGVTLANQEKGVQGFIGLRCYRDDAADDIATWDEENNAVIPAQKYMDVMARNEIPKMDNCEDVNAGSFHVALVNEIGLRKKSLIGDIITTSEVWNHPISEFRSKVIRENITNISEVERQFGIRSKVIVQTTIVYVSEKNATWEPRAGANEKLVANYVYSLDLNEQGEIVGGDWLSRARPDFLWKSVAIDKLSELDPNLALIYEPIE